MKPLRHQPGCQGLYLTVFSGAINVSNKAGSKDFADDKSGYVRNDQTPPQELSEDLGLAREFILGNMPGSLTPLGGWHVPAWCVELGK